MASRVKIKSKVVKSTLANKDVNDMFKNIMGGGEPGDDTSIYVTYPKYLLMKHHASRFIKLLTAMRNLPFMRCFPEQQNDLDDYINALIKQHAQGFSAPDFTQWLPPAVVVAITPGTIGEAAPTKSVEADYAQVPRDVIVRFNEIFALTKSCSIVNLIIVTCKNLIAYKHSLSDPGALKDRFITKSAQMSIAPLPDSSLNFKKMYIDDRLTPEDKMYILTVLYKMLKISHDLYDAVTMPDVDVDEFVRMMMSSIDEVKKHIPRCDQAFNKIIESVSMLKGNFNEYYKDFTASGNPTIIIENFVIDVAKTNTSSPQVTMQFRKIIDHYRKLTAQQASDPRLRSLFQRVDDNFRELEKTRRRADAAATEPDYESDPEPEHDPEPTHEPHEQAHEQAEPTQAEPTQASSSVDEDVVLVENSQSPTSE